MIGPLWSGALFQHVGIRSPFWVAAGVMLFARAFATVVRSEPEVVDEGSLTGELPPTDPS